VKRAASLLIAALIATAGALFAAAPAQAAPGCTPAGFCLHDTNLSNPFAFYSGGVERNTCIVLADEDQGIASFVTENTGVQWWLFHTGTCGGSHAVVHAYTNLDLRFVTGWNNSVVAIMRTALTT
jgi:hypothetical protein